MLAVCVQLCLTAPSTGVFMNLIQMKGVTETDHTGACVENEMDSHGWYLFFISNDTELLELAWALEYHFNSSVSLIWIIAVSPWFRGEWFHAQSIWSDSWEQQQETCG